MTNKPINFDIKKDYSNEEYQKKDVQRFLKEGGDPGFSPERNKAIVEGTIRHNWKLYKQKQKEYSQTIRERAEAAAYYIRYLDNKKGGTAERYFGRRELARLRGIEVAREQKNITRIRVDGYYAKKGVWTK